MNPGPPLQGRQQDIPHTHAREERIPRTTRGRVFLGSHAPHEAQPTTVETCPASTKSGEKIAQTKQLFVPDPPSTRLQDIERSGVGLVAQPQKALRESVVDLRTCDARDFAG